MKDFIYHSVVYFFTKNETVIDSVMMDQNLTFLKEV